MKIPILYVCRELFIGGAQNQLWQLLQYLDRDTFEPTVCNLGAGGEIEQLITDRGIPVIRVNKQKRYSLAPVSTLTHIIKSRSIQMVHSFGFPAHIWATPIAKANRVPAIFYSDHHGFKDHRSRNWIYQLNGLVSYGDDLIFAHCQKNAENLHKVCGTPAHKIKVLYNGVEISRYGKISSSSCLRKELGLGPEIPIICMVARFTPEKAFDHLLMAAQQLLRKGIPCHFVCVGDGVTRPLIEKMVADWDLSKHVAILGWRLDIPEILAESAIGVLASHREGLPIVMLEAMAAGLPVVCSDVGGCREAVIHGETGFLVSDKDSGELTRALECLLVDPGLAKRFGEAGRLRAKKFFDTAVNSRLMQNFYLGWLRKN